MTCKELSLPHTTEIIEFPDMKKEAFLKINPNGRVPAIQDPNTGVSMRPLSAVVHLL